VECRRRHGADREHGQPLLQPRARTEERRVPRDAPNNDRPQRESQDVWMVQGAAGLTLEEGHSQVVAVHLELRGPGGLSPHRVGQVIDGPAFSCPSDDSGG